MDYLTYEEYKDFSFTEITDVKFNSLIKKASAILNNITSYFYVKNDIAKDNAWRVKQFKMALAAQVEYFSELDATTFESINNAPQSFSAGRTTVSNASRFVAGGENESKSLVPEEVFIFLEGTGLLYTGVGVMSW